MSGKLVLLLVMLGILAVQPASANGLDVSIGDGGYGGVLTHGWFRLEMARAGGDLGKLSDTVAFAYTLPGTGLSPWIGYSRRGVEYYAQVEVLKTELELVDGELVEVPYTVTETVKRRDDETGVAFGMRYEQWMDHIGFELDAGHYVKGIGATASLRYRIGDSFTVGVGYSTSEDTGFDGLVGKFSLVW